MASDTNNFDIYVSCVRVRGCSNSMSCFQCIFYLVCCNGFDYLIFKNLLIYLLIKKFIKHWYLFFKRNLILVVKIHWIYVGSKLFIRILLWWWNLFEFELIIVFVLKKQNYVGLRNFLLTHLFHIEISYVVSSPCPTLACAKKLCPYIPIYGTNLKFASGKYQVE
jgi:hypothetical protein